MSPSHATINDYLDLIRLRIAKHVSAFSHRVQEIESRSSKAGTLGGSRHFLLLSEALQNEFPLAAADVLKALPEAYQIGGLDRGDLLNLTGPRLNEMLSSMISLTNLEQYLRGISPLPFRAAILSSIDECRSMVPVLVRQCEIGFDRIWDGDGHSVKNTINAGQIFGAVQQGTISSSQHSSVTVDRMSIEGKIQNVEESLADPANDANVVNTIRCDIATVKAQLAKREPSRSVLAEVGKTMRNLVEGVAAGLLTPSAASAVMALSTIL